MISDRPPEIEDCAVPGHWEDDLIIGSTSTRQQSTDRQGAGIMVAGIRRDDFN